MNQEEINKLSFEEAMNRLEQIVRTMEKGEAPLEESLRLFEEGTALVARCSKALDSAQLRVTQVHPGEDGTPTETEFEYHE